MRYNLAKGFIIVLWEPSPELAMHSPLEKVTIEKILKQNRVELSATGPWTVQTEHTEH